MIECYVLIAVKQWESTKKQHSKSTGSLSPTTFTFHFSVIYVVQVAKLPIGVVV